MRYTRILIAVLAVTSLALTPTPTPEPTTTPTEAVVKTADGASVFVEGGKLYKVDAGGAKTETELSKEVFTDVFEAGDLVKQLHPEYFGEDQSALKEELLPKGVKGGRIAAIVEQVGFGSDDGSSVHYMHTVGKVVEVARIREKNGSDKIVGMLASYGSRNPAPLSLATIDGDETTLMANDLVLLKRSQYETTDFLGKNNLGHEAYGDKSVNEASTYFQGKIVASPFVIKLYETNHYESSAIFQLGLSEEQTQDIKLSQKLVEEAYLEYKSQKPKKTNSGTYIDAVLEIIRNKQADNFSGLYPYFENIFIVTEER